MQTCYCLNPECSQPQNERTVSHCATCGTKLLLRDRYRAYKRLGQGGFGTTFLARDRDMPSQPWRVIKQLRIANASKQVADLSKELFMREAQVLEQLGEHSQIPTLYAYFEEGGHFYLVQEFVLGTTLSSELQRNGPLAEDEVKRVMREVLLILSYVHSKNTVHRDIKPANLIRRKDDNRLVLIDFGAVKQMGITGLEEMPSSVTAIRSQGFSPPEQVAGQTVGPASDLYALGATCLNLLTQKSPTRFFDHKIGRWNWHESLELSEHFAQVMERVLSPSMSERYESTTAVLRALQQVEGDTAASRRPTTTYATTSNTPKSIPISKNWSKRVDTGFQPVSPYREEQPRPSKTGFKPHESVANPGLRAAAGSTTSLGIRRNGTGRRIESIKPSAPPSMEGQDLRDRNLAKQNLAGGSLRGADLRGTNLSGADLRGADLRGVTFSGPPPLWQQAIVRGFAITRTLAGLLGGLLCLLIAVGAAGYALYYLTANLLVAGAAGLIAGMLSGWYFWKYTGQRLGMSGPNAAATQRYTLLKGADLRKARLDGAFRQHAKRQGARLA